MAKKSFKVGDKVKFVKGYDGYFKPESDQTLTVKWVEPNDDLGWNGQPVGGKQYVKLEELEKVEKYHLIKSSWLEKVSQPMSEML